MDETATYREMVAAANYNDEARISNWAVIDGADRPDGPRVIVADDDDLVPHALACPTCRENRVDWLFIFDDWYIECQTCGTIYELGAATFQPNALEAENDEFTTASACDRDAAF